MKLQDIRTWVTVPPNGIGGSFWIIVKVTTDDGIEGIGECYGVPFSGDVACRMVEDTFERFIAGADPHDVETLFRRAYSAGFTQRPDVSMMGVFSGIEIAVWDILGKASGQPVHRLIGGRFHDRIRTYTYLYPRSLAPDGSRPKKPFRDVYHDGDAAAERALEYVEMGFTALKQDPAGPYSFQGGRELSLHELARSEYCVRRIREAVGRPGRHPRRHPRADDHLVGHPPRAAPRALRSPLVRGAVPAGPDGRHRARWRGPPRSRSRPGSASRRRSSSTRRSGRGSRSCSRTWGGAAASGRRGRSRSSRSSTTRRSRPTSTAGRSPTRRPPTSPSRAPTSSSSRPSGATSTTQSSSARFGGRMATSSPPTEPGLGIELDEEAVLAHPYETGGRLHLEMCQTPLPSDNAKRIDRPRALIPRRAKNREADMTETFSKWDAAEHIHTPKDARLYLEACADEDPGDGSLIRAALNDVARAGNMTGLARDAGLSREGLYKALSADGNPTFATVMRITRALGLRLSIS